MRMRPWFKQAVKHYYSHRFDPAPEGCHDLILRRMLVGKGCHDLILRQNIWHQAFHLRGVAVGDSFWITELLVHLLLEVQFGFQFAYLVITLRTCSSL